MTTTGELNPPSVNRGRLAETAESVSIGLDVPGTLGDIVIVFVDLNPAALQVAQAGSACFRLRNFNGGAIRLRWLRSNSKKSKVREAVLDATVRDDDAGRARLESIYLTAVVR